MYNILKIACEELSIDQSVVKVAGILDRLQSWYKNLFNPEYKELVNNLRNDSDAVKNNIKTLYKFITKIDNAIKDGDVDMYAYAIENIKLVSKDLVEDLNKLNIETNVLQEKDKQEPDLKNIQRIIVTDRNKEYQKPKIIMALKKGNIPEETINSIVNDPSNFESLWGTIENALLQGTILESRLAEQSPEVKERNGEMWVTIQTPEFKIPSFPITMQLKGVVTDLFVRGFAPRPEARLKNIFWFRVLPMAGKTSRIKLLNRIKEAGKVESKFTYISGIELAKIIIQAYKELGVSNPTAQLVSSTWAQIVLEAGRDANGIKLHNNNFGGVTAGNADKQWNETGWISSDKDWYVENSGLKFKSYDTPLEGAKEYIKTLAYLFPDSLKLKAQGDQMQDAKYLKTKNYYGNVDPQKYGGPMVGLSKEFMSRIYPQLNGEIIDKPLPAHKEEAPNNFQQEVNSLGQYLGVSIE